MSSPPLSFTDGSYTLLMIDTDIPSTKTTIGTPDMPFVHWLKINMPGDDVNNGETVFSYRGPQPPSPSQNYHHYYFLLYKQKTPLTAARVTAFSSQSCPLPGRQVYQKRGNLFGRAGHLDLFRKYCKSKH